MAVNGVKLLDLIDSSDAFVSELASPLVGVITWSQRDHLIHIQQPRDRNDKLLEFLTRRSVADFKKFTTVFSKYQSHLVPLLVTDGGETFLLCSYLYINNYHMVSSSQKGFQTVPLVSPLLAVILRRNSYDNLILSDIGLSCFVLQVSENMRQLFCAVRINSFAAK